MSERAVSIKNLPSSQEVLTQVCFENILPELKTVLPNACLHRGFGRQADFVIKWWPHPPMCDISTLGRFTVASERISE